MQAHFVKARIHFAVYPRTYPYRRCKITSNPPNRTIWFVDAPLWFEDAAFCISKHPTSVKNHLQFRTFPPKPLHNPNKCLTFAAPEPPSLLTMLKSGVVLFYTTMRLLFDKSFMQPDDMVELLRHRGLEIENPQRVSHYIRNIGYYRLSAYMFPFLRQPKDEHRFKLGSNFQDALNLYRFDKKLRLLA